MPKRKNEDKAAATTRIEHHWFGDVESRVRTGESDPIAKSGTSDITIDNDDAKPVKEKEVNALKKLKKDKEAVMRRIEQAKQKGEKRRKKKGGLM